MLPVTFSKPRTYNKRREIEATLGEDDYKSMTFAPRLFVKEQGSHGLWYVCSWEPNGKGIYETVIKASGLDLRTAKKVASELLQKGEKDHEA